MTDFSKPLVIDRVDQAFPSDVLRLMPPYEEIPEEFRRFFQSGTKWNRLVSDCFFNGLEELSLTPKAGIDPDVAWIHVQTILRSFQPKHEHKEAACAYLLSLWFDDAKWKRRKRKDI